MLKQMLYKRDIVNTLFVASFPIYGIGIYVSASFSPSIGYTISIIPHIGILLFYLVDLAYQKEIRVVVNWLYLLMTVFLFLYAFSLFVSLYKSLPEINMGLVLTKSLLIIIPFQSFVVVRLYNADETLLSNLTFITLSILLLFNLAGYYGLGLSNEVHSIEGRINFPFLDGIYSGACLVAIISLMLVYYMKTVHGDFFKLNGAIVFLIVNLLLQFFINSRLTIMVFLLVFCLLLFNVVAKTKMIYWIAIFTLPILLGTGRFIYEVLTLPLFKSIMQRVDVWDVTTFNGRAFLWKDGIDWLLYDRQGLMFGHGYRGHYFFYLISDVAELWNEEQLHHLHMHSSSLEMLVSQGLVTYLIFLILLYNVFIHFMREYHAHRSEAVFLSVVVFLMFIVQVDTFVYMDSLGALIFAWLVSSIAIQRPGVHTPDRRVSSER